MKQAEIASLIGITYQQYQKYEYDKIKPNLSRFLEISNILQVPNNITADTLMIDYDIINYEEAVRIIKEHKLKQS